MIEQNPSIDQMKDAMRAPWIAGDFGAMAREIGAPEAENFVVRMKLEPGERVLDVACGTGNVTIPLARRGATVTGLDMMPHLLEEARVRAAREGLRIRFDEGFAETLPYPDGSFDVLVSMFGNHVFSISRNRCFGDGARPEAWRAACLGQLDSIWLQREDGCGCRPTPSAAASRDDLPFPLGRRSHGTRQVEAGLRCGRNQRRARSLGVAKKRRWFRRILRKEFWPNTTYARSP
jgi:SAM-dependent methyltransferase